MEYRTADELTAGLDEILGSPASAGTVELIVRRPAENEREVLDEGMLDLEEGLLGDMWHRRGSSRTPDGSANPDAQLTRQPLAQRLERMGSPGANGGGGRCVGHLDQF